MNFKTTPRLTLAAGNVARSVENKAGDVKMSRDHNVIESFQCLTPALRNRKEPID